MRVTTTSTALALALLVGGGCASTPTSESGAEMVDSSVITGKVKTALAAENLSSLMQVEVETFRDVVQLSGFVDTEEEKARAGEIAEGVEGVGRVENSLIVKPAS